MSVVPVPTPADGPVFAEVNMGAEPSASTVRATVVQASTIFYDTPATLGPAFSLSLASSFLDFVIMVLVLLGFCVTGCVYR